MMITVPWIIIVPKREIEVEVPSRAACHRDMQKKLHHIAMESRRSNAESYSCSSPKFSLVHSDPHCALLCRVWQS